MEVGFLLKTFLKNSKEPRMSSTFSKEFLKSLRTFQKLSKEFLKSLRTFQKLSKEFLKSLRIFQKLSKEFYRYLLIVDVETPKASAISVVV